MDRREKRLIQLFLAVAALVVFIGMFIPVMEIDAAQYASIAKQMWQEKSFLQIFHRNLNYLDKPPLLFWLSGLSMGIFGFNDFAYKLPSVLFSILGVWSVFGFAKHYYGERTGYWAALMYATNVAFFLFNADIRTDTIIINLLIFSVYQLILYRDNGSKMAFLSAFAGIGLSMLAKGPLGLVFSVLAVGGDVLMHRNWKFIFRWEWLVGLLIVSLILLPMCIGLYQQYDAQPNNWVNGEKGVSGLKFYFWTQSFGRLTGDSIWATAYSNNPDTFYLTTTFLWAFLPWTPLFAVAFFNKIIEWVKGRFKVENREEWICFFAFLLPLIALSRSGYQLNHYIYIVMPFTSVMSAQLLVRLSGKGGLVKWSWRGYAWFFTLAVAGLSCFILNTVFPSVILWPLLVALGMGFFLFRKQKEAASYQLTYTVLLCFVMLNGSFYPNLLEFQLGKKISAIYNAHKTDKSRLYFYKTGASHSLDFYQNHWVSGFTYENTDSMLGVDHVFVYTNKNGLKSLKENDIPFQVIDSMDYFRVTLLNWDFLIPETRENVIRKRYFIELSE